MFYTLWYIIVLYATKIQKNLYLTSQYILLHKLFEPYWKILLQKCINKCTNVFLSSHIINQPIFEYNDPMLMLLKYRNHTEFTRKLILATIITKLCKLTIKSLAYYLVQKIIKLFFIHFYNLIWVPKCKAITYSVWLSK